MRIALVIERFLPGAGGVENVAWQVAHTLARHGEDVTVLAREIDAQAGVETERIRAPRAWQPIRISTFSRQVAQRLARGDFDVVHGFSHTRTQDLFRAGGGSHRDWLRRTHAGAGRVLRTLSPRYRIRFAIERDVFERSDQRIQCASRLVADVLEREHRVGPERILLLPNAVDAAAFDPEAQAAPARALRAAYAPGDARVWLLPASGWHRKGLDTALRALAARPKEEHLWVAGSDRPDRWRARARALGVAGRAHFLGRRSDMPAVYAAADAVVLPTRYDPFANATLEAAAAARPIVTTTSNGAGEWLGDALLVLDRADDAEGLAAHLGKLVDVHERVRRGKAMQARAATLDWSSHVRALRDEYASIVERRARAGR
ncbi:MAG: glycosyltransferase family 4 protein [bacterium]|nr:glycosyltransferase family 4 protein [bacterium]